MLSLSVEIDVFSRGTGNGESATNNPRLLQDHRERRRHELAAPLAYPWRARAKATARNGIQEYAVTAYELCN